MRPYYPFNNKLFCTTTHCFECPYINDTLNVRACLCKRRQFSGSGAVSIQEIHTVQRTSSPCRAVGATYGDFHPLFLTRNQAKILILKGLDQRRSTPWDWGIIFIVLVIRCLICMLDGIIITPSCDEDVQHWTNIRRPTSCIGLGYDFITQ